MSGTMGTQSYRPRNRFSTQVMEKKEGNSRVPIHGHFYVYEKGKGSKQIWTDHRRSSHRGWGGQGGVFPQSFRPFTQPALSPWTYSRHTVFQTRFLILVLSSLGTHPQCSSAWCPRKGLCSSTADVITDSGLPPVANTALYRQTVAASCLPLISLRIGRSEPSHFLSPDGPVRGI